MFQSFDDASEPAAGPGRLARLRERLAAEGLDGFLVPRADEHQGEYVPKAAERLAWLTGFTGSAGFAVVLADAAAVFVDGRYTLQVREQTDERAYARCHVVETPPARWLAERLKGGMRIGYDPMLHTVAQVRRFEKACAEKGATLEPVAENPIDAIWDGRPAPALGTVRLHPSELAGASPAEKLAKLEAALGKAGVDAAVLTQPDSIAWLFNVRGSDVAHNPVPLAFAVLRTGAPPQLFIDGRKLSNAVRAELSEVAEIAEPAKLAPALEALGQGGARVLLDPDLTADAIGRRIAAAGGVVVEGQDPVLLPKAVKNAAEIAGTRRAHLRDGAAVTRFLRWLEETAPRGGLDEIAVAEALERFRAETGALKDISFDTISGAGAHAALPHYRVTRASSAPLRMNEIYLIDSGGQYEDGTTDITRTVIVGQPTAEMRDRFTRVLAGMIAVSTARFPVGTTGAQLDPLARVALWKAGLDFDHGTGHGVGVYLSVHEGPQRISKLGTTPLEAGMILSNEPGYYKEGAFGIRIENLLLVTPAEPIEGGERPMHGFETLTFAPIDRRLIEPSQLAPADRSWLDAYHAKVAALIGPLVDEETRAWLMAATAPLGG
jgi:Xaa-Pro aminopeptidase